MRVLTAYNACCTVQLCVHLQCTLYVHCATGCALKRYTAPTLAPWGALAVHTISTRCTGESTNILQYTCSVLHVHLLCKCWALYTTLLHRGMQLAPLAYVVHARMAPRVQYVLQQRSAPAVLCCGKKGLNMQFMRTAMHRWRKNLRVWKIALPKNCALQQLYGTSMCQPRH